MIDAKQYIRLLRNTNYEQCQKRMIIGETCCAVGLIAKDINPDWISDKEIPENTNNQIFALVQDIRLKYGVMIVSMNDEGKTFRQIANAIETAMEKDLDDSTIRDGFTRVPRPNL
jgi:hypothetical protein